MVNEKSFALGLSIYHFINGYRFVFHYFHVLKLFIAPALPVPFSLGFCGFPLPVLSVFYTECIVALFRALFCFFFFFNFGSMDGFAMR